MSHIIKRTVSAIAIFASAGCSVSVVDGQGGGGGEPGPTCADFADAAPENTVSIRVRNSGEVPVYLNGSASCNGDADYALADPAGQPIDRHAGPCNYTCEDLQESSGVCAADACAPTVVMVPPGGVHEMVWQGVVFDSVEMPASCFYDDLSGTTCDIRLLADAGEYTAGVSVYFDATCDEVGNGNCACAEGEDSCTLWNAYLEGESTTVEESFAFPAAAVVELVASAALPQD